MRLADHQRTVVAIIGGPEVLGEPLRSKPYTRLVKLARVRILFSASCD